MMPGVIATFAVTSRGQRQVAINAVNARPQTPSLLAAGLIGWTRLFGLFGETGMGCCTVRFALSLNSEG
ncbi:hypothetical protein A6R72_01420 [Xanthomonas translucens pv. graminis]|nr:hypothetical protein A6R72_01420 [Xanthomonas translucens pv. graminis]